MNSLPVEVITSILNHLNVGEDHDCDHPSSSAYWSVPLQTQAAFWERRVAADRTAWNSGVELRTISRQFDHAMSARMNQSVILAGPANAGFVPRSHLLTSPCKRIKIYSTSGCSQGLQLLRDNSATIKSFFVEMGRAPSTRQWPNPLPPLDLRSTSFPLLTSFTFRTNAGCEWLRFDTLVELLRNSPCLKHLTVFQLLGPPDGAESMEGFRPRGEPACQLVSLHVRRAWALHPENLQFIVAKSHSSLRQLTWVLEKYVTSREPGEYNKLGRKYEAYTFFHGFRRCRQIETLRIADLVRDEVPPRNIRREAFNWRSYMGEVLDSMMPHLAHLQHLEVCGTIRLPLLHAWDKNVLPFRLKSLFIDRHFGYCFGGLIRQLERAEGPLSRLEKLAIDEQVEVDCPAVQWHAMRALCERRGISISAFHGGYYSKPIQDHLRVQ
ncbi:hypothetical protein PGTUg99_003948 [Puccinia graminis f. sp. tritici]|uniref:F-box domain-containing protein n=1 Tax=Puccinia graminis f. sp. tritici TaxID=56615 RepID=A0A5B0RQF1_PUCGR|nr:hypothetical protein PGTUg99_003948 [Puccinia graminis f. sp. tritici]